MIHYDIISSAFVRLDSIHSVYLNKKMEKRRPTDPVEIYRGYNPRLNEGALMQVCECGKSFSTVEALEAHRKSKGYACAALMEEEFEELQSQGARYLKCHCCPKMFKTEEARLIHEDKKHPVDPKTGSRYHRSY